MNDDTQQGGTGGEFEDPTSPTWGTPEPTQPVPTSDPPVVAPSPYAAPQQSPAPEQSAAPQGSESTAAPAPYGQVPYGQVPYGQVPYGQPEYSQPEYGQNPYGQAQYGQTPYGQPSQSQSSVPYAAPQQNSGALALTIVSAIGTLMCCLLCVPSLILGIVALSKQSTDPLGSARMTRYGWIALAVSVALAVLAVVAFIIIGAASGAFDGSTSYEYEGL